MKWFFMAIMAIAIVAVNEVNLGHRGFFIINSLKAEEFKVEKVRKILTAKKSLYFENGIFHNGP